jgi:hypothetical protein
MEGQRLSSTIGRISLLIHPGQQTSRHCSNVCCKPPSLINASRLASTGVIPALTLSPMCI